MSASPEERAVWRPVILDRSIDADGSAWRAFLDAHPVWRTRDVLRAQLLDLVRSRHPRKVDLSEAECAPHIADLLGDLPLERFGRWVYYPWSGELVHLLGPAEFRELRSDRNRFKLTPAESTRLAGQTVGVVGLSVGNVIAVTMAQEGVAGHIKLADPDHLDLSNLNRIRAGVHHLGLPKAVIAARQILELDPYVSLSVFTEGITDQNLDAFLLDAPRVDVLLDECDGIRMKFRLRERARELRLPVLMETSDRGMLDVERFDLEPDRPVFHGLVGDMRSEELAHIDSERKAILMLKIIGTNTTSASAAASMMEIDRATSAWPQLASDVTLGGATATMAVRRLGLGMPLASGRLYVDLDAHLAHGAPPAPLPDAAHPPELPERGMAGAPRDARAIPDAIQGLIARAILAPSGGNCQPWHFLYDGAAIWVLHDAVRSRNQLDGRHHASMLALGAVLENLRLAAEFDGLAIDVHPFPLADDRSVVARVRVRDGVPPGASVRALHAALHTRVTNRQHGAHRPLSGHELLGLMDAARARNALLEVCVNPRARQEVGAILGAGERIRTLCPALHREMIGELRWTPESTARTRDGIDLATLELTEFQRAAMQVVARPDVAAAARGPGRGRALEEGARDAIAASSAVALLSFDGRGPEAWLRAGGAVQRVWLAATQAGLAMQPMTAILYMFEILEDRPDMYTDHEQRELHDLRARLSGLFPTSRGRTPAFLFRLAHAPDASARSLRLRVEDVLRLGTPEHPGRQTLA